LKGAVATLTGGSPKGGRSGDTLTLRKKGCFPSASFRSWSGSARPPARAGAFFRRRTFLRPVTAPGREDEPGGRPRRAKHLRRFLKRFKRQTRLLHRVTVLRAGASWALNQRPAFIGQCSLQVIPRLQALEGPGTRGRPPPPQATRSPSTTRYLTVIARRHASRAGHVELGPHGEKPVPGTDCSAVSHPLATSKPLGAPHSHHDDTWVAGTAVIMVGWAEARHRTAASGKRHMSVLSIALLLLPCRSRSKPRPRVRRTTPGRTAASVAGPAARGPPAKVDGEKPRRAPRL